ncbi:MAG: HEAT repeat domain-containing protein [Methanomicrobiales archaeon]|nr:HEAT repeat domain-containing protein [Methanomicrobiales archaeon]
MNTDSMADLSAYKIPILVLAIAVSLLLEVFVHYGLGINIIFTHFFYVVLVLAGLWYYRRAVYLAIALGSIHILIEYLTNGAISSDVLIRPAMFIAVAFVVGYLAENMAEEQNTLIRTVVDKTLKFRQSAAIRSGEEGDVRNHPEITARIRSLRRERSHADLVRGLKSSNPDIRNTAAERLGELGDPQAVNLLAEALDDPDPGVRWKAAEALGKLGAPAVDPLLIALRGGDVDVRWKAAVALGDIGDPRAIAPLADLLDDEDRYVRTRAADALGRIGGPSEQVLIHLLARGGKLERCGAALGLGKIGDPAAVEALLAALGDADPDVRDAAVRAFGEIGEPAVAPLIGLLRSAPGDIRREAVRSLVQIGDPAVDRLIQALKETDAATREEAFRALAEMENRRAIEALLFALTEEDSELQRAARNALIGIKRSRRIS